jgi:putative dimethyl sulfoxide reductase chaperone
MTEEQTAGVELNEESMTSEELAALMDSRAGFYRFASNALLHEFTEEQIAQLKTMIVNEEASEEMLSAFAKIKRYLAHAGTDPRTDMAVDYARVFLSAGVYNGLTAEPYESVFTSEDQLMMQDARDDVVKVYRSQGIDVDPELHMPEDHLGLELDFISTTSARCAQLIRQADEEQGDYTQAAEVVRVQRDFITNHILNWIDALIEKVDEFAKLPLYPAIMRIIKNQAQQDVCFLGEVYEALS